jgi:hypothetical protein
MQHERPHLLCLGLLFVTELRLLLGNHSLLLSLTGSLGLRTLGIHLLLQDSLTRLLSLGLVNLSHRQPMILTILNSQLTCSTNALLCLKVLPLLRW